MKKFLNKIGKNFWAYVAWLVVVIVIWIWVFELITRISPKDKVTVFFGTYSEEFEKTDVLIENRPDYLKTVEVFAFMPTQIYFDVFLQVHGYEESDIIILPESRLSKDKCADYYAEISIPYQNQFENLGFFTVGEKVYGIKIHDKDSHESAIDCLDFGEGRKTEGEDGEVYDPEENYYLLFNKNSYHLGNLSDENNQSTKNGAITIANKLLTL